MKCAKCGRPTKVTETRGTLDGNVLRRARACSLGHTQTTYEISQAMFNAAKSDIAKTVRGAAYNHKIEGLREQKELMTQKRLAGTSCPELAAEFNMSVHMARYYTRLPRRKLYPGASK